MSITANSAPPVCEGEMTPASLHLVLSLPSEELHLFVFFMCECHEQQIVTGVDLINEAAACPQWLM